MTIGAKAIDGWKENPVSDSQVLVQLLVGIVGLILLFAQVRLFSIDSQLKKIREILEKKLNVKMCQVRWL